MIDGYVVFLAIGFYCFFATVGHVLVDRLMTKYSRRMQERQDRLDFIRQRIREDIKDVDKL